MDAKLSSFPICDTVFFKIESHSNCATWPKGWPCTRVPMYQILSCEQRTKVPGYPGTTPSHENLLKFKNLFDKINFVLPLLLSFIALETRSMKKKHETINVIVTVSVTVTVSVSLSQCQTTQNKIISVIIISLWKTKNSPLPMHIFPKFCHQNSEFYAHTQNRLGNMGIFQIVL